MTTRTVISGRSALNTYVRSNLSELRLSTCLIICSNIHEDDVGTSSSSSSSRRRREWEEFQKRLGRKVDKVSFITRMQYQLRQIPATITSAFPTNADVQSCVELARRSGVDHILGVGSGSAMDLAKAVSTHLHPDTPVQLVLCPVTLGATMAAMSNVTLLLSPHEEALLPPHLTTKQQQQQQQQPLINSSTVHVPTVLIDDNLITAPTWLQLPNNNNNNNSNSKSHRDAATYSGASSPTLMDASLSSLVISLDAAHAADLSHYSSNNNNVFPLDQLHMAIVHSLTAIHILSSNKTSTYVSKEVMEECQPHVVAALIHAGQLLSFGTHVGERARSIPLAFSSALLPRYFPHANLLSFAASILPSLLPILDHHHNNNNGHLQQAINIIQETIPNLSSETPLPSLSNNTPLTDLTQHYLHTIFIPTMSSFAEGAPDIHQMMDRIDANAALINCYDMDDDDPSFLQTILTHSLSR